MEIMFSFGLRMFNRKQLIHKNTSCCSEENWTLSIKPWHWNCGRTKIKYSSSIEMIRESHNTIGILALGALEHTTKANSTNDLYALSMNEMYIQLFIFLAVTNESIDQIEFMNTRVAHIRFLEHFLFCYNNSVGEQCLYAWNIGKFMFVALRNGPDGVRHYKH